MRETLINNFLRIASIPRESGNEERIANFFVDIAKNNNLYYFKDENNNVLIKKKGNKNSEPMALQAHLDMVCVKSEESNHDFKNKGIIVSINGDKVTAKDTSLGADQGVGLAMMLTILEDNNLNHPDLEFLFTVEEETTFKGAITFPYSKVSSKRMINLDNSKDNSIFIGADGDICNQYYYKGTKINTNMPSYKIVISGFPGGNSGVDIDLSKDNAITTMARLLKDKEILLSSINGGTCENDLATSCEVVISTNLNVSVLFKDLNVNIKKIENTKSFSEIDTKNIINEILELECGYISPNMASANLGLINTVDNEVLIDYVFRSMDEKELEIISNKTVNLDNDFKYRKIYSDYIWKPNKNSNLLKLYRKIYFNEYHEYPINEIWHGAIECTSIKRRIDELDIISIGSIIEKFHTTEETTYISSWLKTYNCLIKMLEVA